MSEIKQQPMSFPIKGAEACPHCGSTERIGQQYIEELKREGKLLPSAYANGLMIPVPLLETLMRGILPAKPTMPILNMGFDVCGKCFMWYCPIVTVMEKPVDIQMLGGLQKPK